MSETSPAMFRELSASVGPMAKLPNNGASYHTGEQVITHLNRALGPGNWSFRVIAVGEEADSDECWAFVEIVATVAGQTVIRQDYGSQAFKRARSTGKFVSKWDDKKAAITDALKRAARLLGVGLDAWANERAPSWRPGDGEDDADERREVEAEMREAARPKPGTVGARVMARAEARHIEENGAVTKSNDGPRPLPTTTDEVRAAAMVTGANPLRARWERLVAEAERVQLPTWKGAKAIDAGALSDAQLEKYADSLEGKIAAHTGAAA